MEKQQRVQTIAANFQCSNQQNSGTAIPRQFIRCENEQPKGTTVEGVVLEVPVIDLSSGTHREEMIVQQIREASELWGIFQVVNHGIPDEVIKELQRVGQEFFELPQEEKELVSKSGESGSVEGYGSILQKEVDGKKGWVDHLFHKIWPPTAVNYAFWPRNPPSYKQANEEYGEKVREVSNRLLKWLSLGLGLEGHELKGGVGGEETIFMMKINYYPPCPQPDLALGVPAHTDMSALTILVPNEVPGLQVFRDDHWYDVKYIPNALIVHIGDQIEILSNGKCKAVLHRTTVNKDKTRMSWPVFLEPPPDFEVGPLPKLLPTCDEDGCIEVSKYKTKKFKDYAYCKLNKLPQ